MITVERLTEADLWPVWRNLREYDRLELQLQDYTDGNVVARACRHPVALVGKYRNEPFCVFGAAEMPGCVCIWFFATDQVERMWRPVHSVAKGFIGQVRVKFPGKPVVVEVWERHTTSIRWLIRLGFEPTKHFRTVKGETLRVMEWKGGEWKCAA